MVMEKELVVLLLLLFMVVVVLVWWNDIRSFVDKCLYTNAATPT